MNNCPNCNSPLDNKLIQVKVRNYRSLVYIPVNARICRPCRFKFIGQESCQKICNESTEQFKGQFSEQVAKRKVGRKGKRGPRNLGLVY